MEDMFYLLLVESMKVKTSCGQESLYPAVSLSPFTCGNAGY
jgi:hypothetical protein